eukprot:TRINITY_DN19189_c0_g1_i1.p1 TRINITY_DN19189_c0_g1~~TRINITY_DN19189_c0_g1_i1.p1  ORF type:complete len:420 (-),score=47.40 TRINITY_DN19189_c0_g1_i1:919-2178(-)
MPTQVTSFQTAAAMIQVPHMEVACAAWTLPVRGRLGVPNLRHGTTISLQSNVSKFQVSKRRGCKTRIQCQGTSFPAKDKSQTGALTGADEAPGGTDSSTSGWVPGSGVGREEGRSLILVEWSGDGMREKWRAKAGEALAGLASMARPHNFAPSCIMVFLGAWLASDRCFQLVMWSPSVWLVALLSGTIAVASMLANDVFDFRSGVDRINGPDKPLVSGRVHPDDAELAAGCMYAAVVLGCCCLPSLPLRLLIGGATVITYIYTPFLKRITVIKNITVAAIISSSVLAGALVAGGGAGLERAAPVSLFLFLSVVMREILMDIGDIVGDKAAGIKTLAVRFGRSGAATIAGAALASAHAVMVRLGPQTRIFAVAATVVLLPLYASVYTLINAPTDPQQLSSIIDKSMLYIAIAAIMLFSTL